MSAPYSKTENASIGAKPAAYANGDPIPATLWDSVVSLQGDQSLLQSNQTSFASALTRLTRQEQFYQVTNSTNTNVNDEPSGSNFSSVTFTGLASDADDWRRFESWYPPGNYHDTNHVGAHPLATNTDTSLFGTEGSYGVKCKVAGYYKINCNMLFTALVADVAVAVRFAKNGLNDDVYTGTLNGPWQLENPASIGVSAYHSNSFRQSSSVSISEIIYCAENDVLTVHTSRAGVTGTVTCHPLTCQLRVEYKGPST